MADTSSFVGFLGKVLPWIGAAATGNVPGLIAMAADTVGRVIGKPVEATADSIATAVAGIKDPAVLLQLKQEDNEFQAKCQQMGFQHVEELRKLDIQEETAFVQDTDAARKSFASNDGVFWLGVLTIVVFAILIGALLYGCYAILTHGIDIKDPGTIAVVFSFLGTILGYLASNVQQVYGFFFGSSKGSADKTTAMSAAVANLSQLKAG